MNQPARLKRARQAVEAARTDDEPVVAPPVNRGRDKRASELFTAWMRRLAERAYHDRFAEKRLMVEENIIDKPYVLTILPATDELGKGTRSNKFLNQDIDSSPAEWTLEKYLKSSDIDGHAVFRGRRVEDVLPLPSVKEYVESVPELRFRISYEPVSPMTGPELRARGIAELIYRLNAAMAPGCFDLYDSRRPELQLTVRLAFLHNGPIDLRPQRDHIVARLQSLIGELNALPMEEKYKPVFAMQPK